MPRDLVLTCFDPNRSRSLSRAELLDYQIFPLARLFGVSMSAMIVRSAGSGRRRLNFYEPSAAMRAPPRIFLRMGNRFSVLVGLLTPFRIKA